MGATAVGARTGVRGRRVDARRGAGAAAVVTGQGSRGRHARNLAADCDRAPCDRVGDVASPCEAIARRAARRCSPWWRVDARAVRPIPARPGSSTSATAESCSWTARAKVRRRCSSFPARAATPRRGTSSCRRMTRFGPRRTTSSPRPSWHPAPTRCNRPWRKRHRSAHTTGPTPGPTVPTGQLMCRNRIACSRTSTTWSRSSARRSCRRRSCSSPTPMAASSLDLLARTHPELVAGIVMVDPMSEFLPTLGSPAQNAAFERDSHDAARARRRRHIGR